MTPSSTSPSPLDGLRARPLRLIGAIFVGLAMLFWGWDLSQQLRNVGPYRLEFQGQVVSARPGINTIWAIFGSSSRRHRSFSSRSSSSSGRNYLLTVRNDFGHDQKIAVDAREYQKTMIPEYVVGHGGQIEHYGESLQDSLSFRLVERAERCQRERGARRTLQRTNELDAQPPSLSRPRGKEFPRTG